MGRATAAAFCNQVASDSDLFAAVVASSEASGMARTIPAERLVELGANRGLSFSADEFLEVWAERQRQRELTDDELGTVAGGIGMTAQAPRKRGGGGGFDF